MWSLAKGYMYMEREDVCEVDYFLSGENPKPI